MNGTSHDHRIHRLLDEAFAGVVMTPEAQDLKEEIRANLLDRVAELRRPASPPTRPRAGRSTSSATCGGGGGHRGSIDGAGPPAVRRESEPRVIASGRAPAFVVRVVVWSLLAVIGIALRALAAAGALSLPAGVLVLASGLAAAGVGLLVGDSLSQQTTTNHPMPRGRAGGYGRRLPGVWGLGLAASAWRKRCRRGPSSSPPSASSRRSSCSRSSVPRRPTATRHGRASSATSHPGDRFEQEPETAARFGIYTVAIWVVALGVFVALGFTVGWWWAALAILGGFAAMMLLLARMLFGAARPVVGAARRRPGSVLDPG